MARIIYSALIDSIRGSVGGTTFQQNKHGYTIKKKQLSVKPNSPRQLAARNRMSLASRTWRDLTTTQRTAYETYASSYPQYAKHNPTSQLSGYSVFMKYNLLRLLSVSGAAATIDTAPPLVDTLSFEFQRSGAVFSCDITSVLGNEDWIILFFISHPLSDTVNFFGSKPKYIGFSTSDTQLENLTSAYSAIYNYTPAVGDLLGVNIIVIGELAPTILATQSQVYEVYAP